MRIAVIVASINRPDQVGQFLASLARQTILPSTVLLSVEKPSDIPELVPSWAKVIFGERGSSLQRNRALDQVVNDSDIVAFYDDDFIPTAGSLDGIRRLFVKYSYIVGATGFVILDGAKSEGINFTFAEEVIAKYERQAGPTIEIERSDGVYGCNMAFRTSEIRELRFDENLPLYGWLEDADFGLRVSKRGDVVKTNAFAGVHLGSKAGKAPGVSLGYSQVVNPAYLVRKGTLKVSRGAKLIFGPVVMNHIRSIRPEAFVDRRGRLYGNWLGLFDLMRMRIDPNSVKGIALRCERR